jgi:mRNA-degrading endonuclease RelE of RelBE toxin-antitoxin system
MRRLEHPTARRVRQAILVLAETGYGDIVKLQGRVSEWRLRVGDWRVILAFRDQGDTIEVVRVLHRREAYR